MTDNSCINIHDFLFKHAKLIIIMVDSHGMIFKSNHHADKLFGRSPVGSHFEQFFSNINFGIRLKDWFTKGVTHQLADVTNQQGLPETLYFTTIKMDEHLMLIG